MTTTADKDKDYNAFSGGERTKIDCSILFSFIEINKIISNFGCNLLFIDELIDSQLDGNALERMLESLKNMVMINKNLSCFIISHKVSANEFNFDKVFKIEKGNGFSKIL
jgi:DNA repair exonuclease SbcCD ATPase subunit